MTRQQVSLSSALPQIGASTHRLGVLCGLAAGVWLGAAEAPVKLVASGLSPFAVSFCMVAGVFTARWTFPTLLKGTRSIFKELGEKKHLIVWAVLAGMLWAVANTLTVFAIRDVGLTLAFPLWNTNSLVGLFWGWLLFGELKGASPASIAKVVLGAVAIVAATVLLGFSTLHDHAIHSSHVGSGMIAAFGASLVWGTMYVPYRKAYISGMNPLSFVTVFTIGELLTVFILLFSFDGGFHSPVFHSAQTRHLLFWLFLGGFVWVVGDIFQQFATRYLGIGRGIPLSNTNQLWGLAWGALVFGELAHAGNLQKGMVVAGSLLMIAGACSISSASIAGREQQSSHVALARECRRYHLDYDSILRSYDQRSLDAGAQSRSWWDYLIVACGLGIFAYLAVTAVLPSIPVNAWWAAALVVIMLLTLGWAVWRLTRQPAT